jgi:aminocarboxymuconate-semialdehyde decarboxylase
MKIDWHLHVHDPKDAEQPRWQGRCPMTLDSALQAHAQNGLDISVISSPVPYASKLDSDTEVLAAIEGSNRYLAQCRERHPDKIVAMATCVPGGGEPFLREFERAVKQDDMRAVLITSSFKGRYPDADEATAFFQLATELDIPVFVHPGEIAPANMADYRLTSSIGRPGDLCLALARLIVRGIFEKFPSLKLTASHLGGGICEVIGRMDFAYGLVDELFFLGPYEPVLIKHPPSHYLRMLYLDSASYHAPAAKMCVETVGADHFLLGTDAPPLNAIKPRALAMIGELGLSAADKDKVMGGNAKALLKI